MGPVIKVFIINTANTMLSVFLIVNSPHKPLCIIKVEIKKKRKSTDNLLTELMSIKNTTSFWNPKKHLQYVTMFSIVLDHVAVDADSPLYFTF